MRDTKKLNTPLHCAASKGQASTVAYLLKKNADPTSFNRAKKTPIDVASTDQVRRAFITAKEGGSAATADAEEQGEHDKEDASSCETSTLLPSGASTKRQESESEEVKACQNSKKQRVTLSFEEEQGE